MDFRFASTNSEKPHPEIFHRERIQTRIDFFHGNIFEEEFKLSAYEPIIKIYLILPHSVVDFGRIFGRFRHIIFKVGNAVEMAKGSQFGLEI